MDITLAIPADTINSVTPRLDCCTRHGQSPTRRIRFALQSRPKLAGNRALTGNVAATAGRLAEHAEKVRVTRVTEWPLCARCAATRRGWLAVAAVCFWGGLALLVGAIVARLAADGPSAALGIPMFTGIALLIVSPAPFVRGSIPRIINARTSDDGSAVVLRDPHPRFAAAVRAALGQNAPNQSAPGQSVPPA